MAPTYRPHTHVQHEQLPGGVVPGHILLHLDGVRHDVVGDLPVERSGVGFLVPCGGGTGGGGGVGGR